MLLYASIHRSEKFNAKLGEWRQKRLRIFHLPPYSPHLNIIETLWRKKSMNGSNLRIMRHGKNFRTLWKIFCHRLGKTSKLTLAS